jgi:predicted MPP superfamily phosphohydrolase
VPYKAAQGQSGWGSLRRFSRRRFFWFGALGTVLLSLGWAAGIEPGLLRVRDEALASPHWPAAQPRLRIAFLADLHVGAPHVPIGRVDELVRIANAAEPDLVLLGGDFIGHVLGGNRVPYGAIARGLAGLRARYGVFAVLGNHDHWDGDVGGLKATLEKVGIVVLENEARRIEVTGGSLWLVGLGDSSTGRADPIRAF